MNESKKILLLKQKILTNEECSIIYYIPLQKSVDGK